MSRKYKFGDNDKLYLISFGDRKRIWKAEDYLYSSARDFYSKKGLIELSYIV